MEIDTERIRSLVRSRDLGSLSSLVRTMPPAQVVRDLEALPIQDATVVFRLLEKDLAVQVFDDLGTVTQADLVSRLGHAPLTEVFAALDPDEQARLLDELPARVATRLVDSFDGHELDATMELLGYPQGTVGRQMSPAAVHARHDETVSQVLDRLARHTGDTDLVTMVPVITADRLLLGILDTVDLLRHPGDVPVVTVMDDDPVVAGTDDDAELVAPGPGRRSPAVARRRP